MTTATSRCQEHKLQFNICNIAENIAPQMFLHVWNCWQFGNNKTETWFLNSF